MEEVVSVSELEGGKGKCVNIRGKNFGVFLVGGEVFVVDNTCPHAGGSLAEGGVSSGEVSCPLHGWRFNLRSGEGSTVPNSRIGTYAARIEDGVVYAEIP